MSTGGIFKLITNNGSQDKLLMATDYLEYRLALICKRNKAKLRENIGNGGSLDLDQSWLPDVNSICKSHMIFINGAFKPFVASGFEYNKITGKGSQSLGANITFTLPVFGDFINDCVVHIKLSKLSAINVSDKVRYVSLLGHRILKKIEFKVNAVVLDVLTSDNYNAFYQFHVTPQKQIGWLRNMGQEIPEIATLSSDPEFDMHKEYRYFGDGNQTFKQKHDGVELWIPLLFWFKDIKNALPSMAIPYGQTDIKIELAPVTDIVATADYGGGGAYTAPVIDTMELYMNNIFLQPEIVNMFMRKFGFSLIRVHGSHKKHLSDADGRIKLDQLKWPTETLYVAFRPVSNLELSQHWYKSAQLTLNNIKVPVIARDANLTNTITSSVITPPTASSISMIFVSGPILSTFDDAYSGFDLVITGGNGYNAEDITQNKYDVIDYIGATSTLIISGTWNFATPNSTTIFQLFQPQVAINSAEYYKETPSIDTIAVDAHSITIFQRTDESFYNSYLPYRFGNSMNTPKDRGWYMINFNYLPGEHQPSGHINLSRAREFFIDYESRTISKDNRAELIVLSDAINFLLVKDGTAVLRYS
jgi:hypothetical protein